MLMRFWLELTRHGLVVHPFGSVITNPTAHARLLEWLELADDRDEVWLLLRIGYSKRPPESARRAIAEDTR
jgi:hypothetical protein